MAPVAMSVIRVEGPNMVYADGRTTASKLIVLPICPVPGKEKECQEALEAILPEGAKFSVRDDDPASSSPYIGDVSIGKPPVQWVSTMLEERGVAIRWNLPQEPA